MSCGETFDWHFTQGEDAVIDVTWKDENDSPIDLTGYVARCQGREEYQSASTLFDVSSTGGGIVIDELNGKLTISIGNGTTAAIAAPISGVFDVEVESNTGIVTNILSGKLIINPEVTKS